MSNKFWITLCCFLQLFSDSGRHDGKYFLQVPRNLRPGAQTCVPLYFTSYRGVMVMVMLTGSGLSFMHSLLLPAVGLHAHKCNHTQTYAHTAGLPRSDDLGWALEAVHGFSSTHPHLLLNPNFLASYYLSSFLSFQRFSSSFTFNIPSSHIHRIIIVCLMLMYVLFWHIFR